MRATSSSRMSGRRRRGGIARAARSAEALADVGEEGGRARPDAELPIGGTASGRRVRATRGSSVSTVDRRATSSHSASLARARITGRAAAEAEDLPDERQGPERTRDVAVGTNPTRLLMYPGSKASLPAGAMNGEPDVHPRHGVALWSLHRRMWRRGRRGRRWRSTEVDRDADPHCDTAPTERPSRCRPPAVRARS